MSFYSFPLLYSHFYRKLQQNKSRNWKLRLFFCSIFSGAKQTKKKISWPTTTYGKSIHLIRLKHFLQTNWNFETLEYQYQYQSIAQTKWKLKDTYSRNYKNWSLLFYTRILVSVESWWFLFETLDCGLRKQFDYK